MQKPIVVSILEIIGGSLSIIVAGKIAKDEHDKKKEANKKWFEDNLNKKADLAAKNIMKYNP